VCVNGESGWLYSFDDALANSANGLNNARWVSYSWYSIRLPSVNRPANFVRAD